MSTDPTRLATYQGNVSCRTQPPLMTPTAIPTPSRQRYATCAWCSTGLPGIVIRLAHTHGLGASAAGTSSRLTKAGCA
jgi:hypothetical protein